MNNMLKFLAWLNLTGGVMGGIFPEMVSSETRIIFLLTSIAFFTAHLTEK